MCLNNNLLLLDYEICLDHRCDAQHPSVISLSADLLRWHWILPHRQAENYLDISWQDWQVDRLSQIIAQGHVSIHFSFGEWRRFQSPTRRDQETSTEGKASRCGRWTFPICPISCNCIQSHEFYCRSWNISTSFRVQNMWNWFCINFAAIRRNIGCNHFEYAERRCHSWNAILIHSSSASDEVRRIRPDRVDYEDIAYHVYKTPGSLLVKVDRNPFSNSIPLWFQISKLFTIECEWISHKTPDCRNIDQFWGVCLILDCSGRFVDAITSFRQIHWEWDSWEVEKIQFIIWLW